MDQNFYKDILISENYITPEDAAAAEASASAGSGTFLDYLLQNEIISRETLGFAIAEHYQTTFSDLDSRAPSPAEIAKLPENVAKSFNAVYVKEDDSTVTIATDNPANAQLSIAVNAQFPGKRPVITFAFPESVAGLLSHYQKELNTRFSEIIKKESRVAPEIFEEIIRDALTYRASDIHFEPQLSSAIVRFRIDGMLGLAGSIPKEYYENVINRIKIQANLRTDEHYAPQDGAIRFMMKDSTVDLRVSVVPTLNGEKIVIRVLAEYVKGLTFADLGLSERNISLLEAASKKPFGMIIVSGPTGSGKTTTLYSLIKKLNTPEVNVTTIEDPVEYRMAGANQIQVNPKTDLTFAKGLRAIVRQDPNIILVGEIRDSETAETAVNAALTGHLLLSTFHANDASTSIPRLLEMDIEPFLLASTLELIVAQRLARKICEVCKESYKEKVSSVYAAYPRLKGYFKGTDVTLFRGKGCAACNGTGYKGRTSVVEMIEITKSMRDLILKRPSAAEVWQVARKEGAVSLFEDGLEKARSGITTVDEVLRVATPVDDLNPKL